MGKSADKEYSEAFFGHSTAWKDDDSEIGKELQRAYADGGKVEKDDNMPSDDAPESTTEAPAVAVVIAEPEVPKEPVKEESAPVESAAEPTDEMSPEEPAVAEPAEPVESAQVEKSEPAEDTMSPEDIQRERSWEGRLKKREEEIAAREAALQSGNSNISGENIAAVIARANELRANPEELDAMVGSFVDDFDIDAVAMMVLVGSAMAGKPSEPDSNADDIVGRIDALTDEVKAAFADMHFGAIRAAHEDFESIADSDGFKAWMATLGDGERAKVESAMSNGNAYQIIGVLNQYKASLNTAQMGDALETTEEEDQDAIDGATMVRGTGTLQIPAKSSGSPDDEYKDAWAKM